MALSLDRWVGKVAIITGASSGIGAAIATELVEQGVIVVALARNPVRLERLSKKLSGKKGQLFPIKADISKEDDILYAFKFVKEKLSPVHILINNADLEGKQDYISDGNTENWQNVFNTNVIGLSITTREAIKDMKANEVQGHIIHINSIVGHQVFNFPGMGVYPASKFAVTALAETLRLELNSLKLKIKITSISPGAVYSEFPPEEIKHSTFFEELINNDKMLKSEDVADAIIYVLSTPPHVQIQELTIRPVEDSF